MATATVETRTVSDDLDAMGVMGLLKTIAMGEAKAGPNFLAWADMTADRTLAKTLRLIAARETSHADIFSRRIAELGDFVDLEAPSDVANGSAILADPAASEEAKADYALGGGEFFDEFDRRAADGSYDPLTAKLMIWYVAEERDSQAQLRHARGMA